MINLNDYDEVDAFQEGEYRKLPANGYVCTVTESAVKSTKTGVPMLVLSFDIAEGSFKNYFGTRDTKPKLFQIISDKNGRLNPYFKGVLTNFEKSNSGFKIKAGSFDEHNLIGKFIGVLFAEEEYYSGNGDIKVTVKPRYTMSVEKVRDKLFNVPAVKRVERRNTGEVDDDFADVEIKDENLPF